LLLHEGIKANVAALIQSKWLTFGGRRGRILTKPCGAVLSPLLE